MHKIYQPFPFCSPFPLLNSPTKPNSPIDTLPPPHTEPHMIPSPEPIKKPSPEPLVNPSPTSPSPGNATTNPVLPELDVITGQCCAALQARDPADASEPRIPPRPGVKIPPQDPHIHQQQRR